MVVRWTKIRVLGEDGPIWAEFHVSVQLANAVSQQRRIVGKRHAHFWKVECVKKKARCYCTCMNEWRGAVTKNVTKSAAVAKCTEMWLWRGGDATERGTSDAQL